MNMNVHALLGIPDLDVDGFKVEGEGLGGKTPRLFKGGGGKGGDGGAAARAEAASKKQQQAYEAQIKQLQASTQLEASKSLDNVVKVESGGGVGADINFGDTQRKKRATSNMATSLGIQ
jgi:hypothetical protein